MPSSYGRVSVLPARVPPPCTHALALVCYCFPWMIRIANGQGFWGDWSEAPVRLVEDGPIDYLTLDYLAEVTMSILRKQRSANSAAGYARDFPPLIGRLAKRLRSRGVRVIANAGGVNPQACAAEVRRLAPELMVAIVHGDDISDRIDDLLQRGQELRNMDTGEPLAGIRDKLLSANAYIGAFPLAEALATGADVVITGRCSDAALALAPMVHQFGWGVDDLHLLAAGTAAGHVVECGAQCTGGNCQADWQSIPDLADIGYPIIEAEPDGVMTITKHRGTGGRVDSRSVREQIVYEIGDPTAYMTPDCVADFTSIQLRDEGRDRVRLTGVRGKPAPEMLKVSIAYAWGWKAVGSLVFSAPDALDKARAADAIVRRRLADAKLEFESIHTEYLGYNACHGDVAVKASDIPEVQLRIGVRARDHAPVERFTRELIPLVLSGPPTATGYGEGRPAVREIVAFWPALIPRDEVKVRVEVVS
ncbi:MAG TPA: acyclic terpene utilization AtuA family protein [Bryobacteraceae bacterium]|nr:acyclic terpene utilization AtuA family protein [Bryobacteraceae bacterium]